VRDKETGKSRGFAFLKYEDQRSTDLAVDNLGGATVMGRMLSVDHVRYKRREEEGVEDNVKPETIAAASAGASGQGLAVGGVDDEGERRRKRRKGIKEESDGEEKKVAIRRPMLEEEKELERLIRDHDEEDPMKEFLIQEKKEEVAKAIEKAERKANGSSRRRDESGERSHRHHRHRHHHRRRHSSERSPSRERRSHRHRSRSRSTERRRHRDRRDRDK
jgi:RNA-binding motif X-linked protein 2